MWFDQAFLGTVNQLAQHGPLWGALAVFAATPLIWLLIGWYVVAFVWHKRGGTRELFTLAAGAVAGYLVNVAIAQLWFRLRPFTTGAAALLVNEPGTLKSFPSDHATAAFFIAVLLTAHRRGWWWSFLLAGAVALGRVAVGVHYPTDVLAGAFVGTVFGLTTIWLEGVFTQKKSLRQR